MKTDSTWQLASYQVIVVVQSQDWMYGCHELTFISFHISDVGPGIFGWPETNIYDCLTVAQGGQRL